MKHRSNPPTHPSPIARARRSLPALLVILSIIAFMSIALGLGQSLGTTPPTAPTSPSLVVKPLHKLFGQSWGEVAAWSPDGRTLAVGVTITVSVGLNNTDFADIVLFWDAESGETRRSSPLNLNLSLLSWSPDGRTVAASSNSTNIIRLLDSYTAQVQRSLVAPKPANIPTHFERTGKPFLRYSYSIRNLEWSSDGGKLISVMVTNASVSDDPSPHTWNDDRISYTTAQVWDIANDNLLHDIVLADEKTEIHKRGISYSQGAGLLSTYETSLRHLTVHTNTLRVWDIANGTQKHAHIMAINNQNEPRYSLFLSPDGNTIAATSNETVRIIERATGRVVHTLPQSVPSTYTPTRLPTWGPTVFPPPLPTTYYTPRPNTDPCAPVTPDAPQPVGTAMPGLPPGQVPGPVQTILPPGCLPPTPQPTASPTPTATADPQVYGSIISATWSPDSRQLAVFYPDSIRLWDAQTGMPRRIISHSFTNEGRLFWSPDGTTLAAVYVTEHTGPGYNKRTTVTLWNATNGKEVITPLRPSSAVWYADWSPVSQKLFLALFEGGVLEIRGQPE